MQKQIGNQGSWKTKFELLEVTFSNIVRKFSPDIVLFATRVNKKFKDFTSWSRDPEAINVFTLN